MRHKMLAVVRHLKERSRVLKLSESWDEMRYRAACSAQEHVIRLAEVCWREDQICSEDVFRWVAADAILELGFSHGGRGG